MLSPRQGKSPAASFRALRSLPPVVALARAARPTPCHLVGGVLRDRYLGRPLRDLDAVVERRGEAIAERLAAELPARLVRLGGDRFAAFRLVGGDFLLDLWDREGADLRADLERRDFTVNSVAMDLENGRIVDPCGGLEDLERRVLRATGEGSFAADPLRVLRLVRFATHLPRFEVDGRTLELARDAAPALAGIAPERVQEELRWLFRSAAGLGSAGLLAELGLFPGLWRGEPGRRGEARVLDARFRRLAARLADVAAGAGPEVDLYAATTAVLAASLEDDGEPAARAARLRSAGLLSHREAGRVTTLLSFSALPRQEGPRRWLLHRAGPLWPTALLVLGALDPGLEDAAAWRRAAGDLAGLAQAAGAAIFDPPLLVDGHEVCRELGIAPGPQVGRLLEGLRRAQIEGRITSRAGALDLLRRMAREPGT